MARLHGNSRIGIWRAGGILAALAMVLVPVSAQQSLAATRAAKPATIKALILPGDRQSHASAINAQGDVTGFSAVETTVPFIYYGHGSKAGKIAALVAPSGFDDFFPSGIDDTDDISASAFSAQTDTYTAFDVRAHGNAWNWISLEPGSAKSGPHRPGAASDSQARQQQDDIQNGMATGIADGDRVALWNYKTNADDASAQLSLPSAGSGYHKYWEARPANAVYFQPNAVDEDSREGGYESTQPHTFIANNGYKAGSARHHGGRSFAAISAVIWRTQGTAVILKSLDQVRDSQVTALAEGRKLVSGKAVRRDDINGPGIEWVEGAGWSDSFDGESLSRNAVYWYGQQTKISNGNGTGNVVFNGAVALATPKGFSNSEAEGISPDSRLIVGDVNNQGIFEDITSDARNDPAQALKRSLAANSARHHGELGLQDAYVWQNGKGTDLNTLLPSNSGWHLTTAYGVNDAGQIVGDGLFNGNPVGFLLKTNLT